MEKVLGILFAVSALAFIIQTVSSFFGLDSMDFDFDIPDDGGFGFFTVKNFISFILGFSSAAFLSLKYGYSKLFALILGLAMGSILVAVTFIFMRMMHKLQQVNEVEDYEYRRLDGTVTIRIPENRKGMGKVEFVINERIDEMQAVTDSDEPLVKGTLVNVVKKLDSNVLLVNKRII